MTTKITKTREKQNPFITTSQLAQFNNGTNFRSYEFMGAIPSEIYSERGYSFAVWAPNAISHRGASYESAGKFGCVALLHKECKRWAVL